MSEPHFITNQVYNRRADIHKQYGGSWQSGISPSGKFPYIFIFTGKSGEQHGYSDAWDDLGIFEYTGEGQLGDMKFTKGNLALRDHVQNGKRVFLFEIERKGYVKFIDEVEFLSAHYDDMPDRTGAIRKGIKFSFKRKSPTVQYKFPDDNLGPEEPTMDYGLDVPNITERKGLVKSRVGQGKYRKKILHRWNNKCAVTGFENLNILIASHIVPWSEATDIERVDVHNGILLSPTYDALFDQHLITFDNNGSIVLSNKIKSDAFRAIGVTGKEVIKNLSKENHVYLERHRTRFYESN